MCARRLVVGKDIAAHGHPWHCHTATDSVLHSSVLQQRHYPGPRSDHRVLLADTAEPSAVGHREEGLLDRYDSAPGCDEGRE